MIKVAGNDPQTDRKNRRKSRRHELTSSKRIDVKVFRPGKNKEGEPDVECPAKIVDISQNGFKLHSKTSFGFQENIAVELPSRDGGVIRATAEVRWVEPNTDGRTWSAGCLLAEGFPQDYIDEMAQEGVLNRRICRRQKTDHPAVGRWEMTQEELPISILDVSSQGVCIRADEPAEIGKRIRIKITENSGMTARAVWQKEVENGYLIGCEVVEGSPLAFFESNLSSALQGNGGGTDRYEVLSFCALSLFLVMLIREWFF